MKPTVPHCTRLVSSVTTWSPQCTLQLPPAPGRTNALVNPNDQSYYDFNQWKPRPMHACLWVVWCQYDTCSTYLAALWGILWTLSAIQEWLFGLVGLIEWFYWAVYHVVLFVAIVQRKTQSVIAALLLMPCCIPSQSAGPSSLGAVWELWLFDRGKHGKACSARSNFASDDWLSYNRLQFRTGPVREPILISLLLSHLNELRGLEPNLPLGLDWILWQPRE